MKIRPCLELILRAKMALETRLEWAIKSPRIKSRKLYRYFSLISGLTYFIFLVF